MPSNTFSVRIDLELLDTIKMIAEQENRTVNQQIVHFIEKGLARYEVEQRAIESLDAVGQTNKEKIAK